MRKLNHQAAETVLLQCGTGRWCLKSKQVMEERAVMHIRSWTGILSGVAAAAVFAVIVFLTASNCVQVYLSFPLNDYWIELLVNYSAGPIRRGLLGEVLEDISFIPVQILWIAIIVICYAFIYAVIFLRMRALRIPFIMQIGVYLSPLLCFCQYFNYYFVNRDIFLLAGALLILLPISSLWRHREKADTRSLALCSISLTAVGSVLLFSHVASCTLLVLPLLLMALMSRNLVDFISFTVLPAIAFLAEILIILNFMAALPPDGIMALLDDIKSRYPVVPGRMDDLILVVLRSLGVEGQAYWREVAAGNIENLPEIFSEAALLTAVAIIPAALVLFRREEAEGSSGRRYLRISAIVVASLAPMALTFVAVDFFRWRNWAFFMLLCSLLLLSSVSSDGEMPEGDRSSRGFRIRYAMAAVIAIVSAAVACHDLSIMLPSKAEAFDRGLNLSGRYKILQVESPDAKTIMDIPGDHWDFIMNPRQSVAEIGALRTLDLGELAVTSACYGAMTKHYSDIQHRRLFMRGYQMIRAGEGKLRRPPRSFGFIVSDMEKSLYYPTVAYSGTIEIGGQKVSINSMYDDYAVIPSYMNMEKLKVYHAMYNLKGDLIRCSEPALELGR